LDILHARRLSTTADKFVANVALDLQIPGWARETEALAHETEA
jgi:hypothetical protein